MPDNAVDKDRRYRELVRLAYLILPGEGSREFRLAMARRIVDRNLPRRPVSGRTFTEARERVLRQAMKPPSRLRVRLLPWLRGLPPTVPGNAALAQLTPDLRTAYVLRRVTGLRRYVVHDLLVGLGIEDAPRVLDEVEAMEDLRVVAPAQVGRRRRYRRSRLPLVIATVTTCALLAAFAVEERNHSIAAARATRTAHPVAVTPPPAAVTPTPPAVRRAPAAAVPRAGEVRFWSGRLPANGGSAALVCRTTGARSIGYFVRGTVRTAVGDCARGVAGLWWKAPSKRWFYLAAARPGLAPRLVGREFKVRDGLLVAKGGRAATPPKRKITLKV